MPHFTIKKASDGTVQEILKDGSPYTGAVTLEQLHAIVTIYFELSAHNLHRQREATSGSVRRRYGLQAFLMSLTGLEAFTNVFFHLRSQELGRPEILKRVQQTHGSLSRKIDELIDLTSSKPVVQRADLISKVFDLTQLRNEIVHPRWSPASVSLNSGAIQISGLVENRQALFEDYEFCQEARLWCLLLIARIGEAAGVNDISTFLMYWTANHGLSLSGILHTLRKPTDTPRQE